MLKCEAGRVSVKRAEYIGKMFTGPGGVDPVLTEGTNAKSK